MPVKKTLLLALLIMSAQVIRSLADEDVMVLSEEFLEYLGQYEKLEGEWVDPYEFVEALEKMASLAKSADGAKDNGEQSDEN